MAETEVLIVGAGPIGLELAIALKRAGVPYLQIEAGQIGQMIADFPPQTRFFSSNERIAIAGVPLQTPDQSKATREQYLAYLRCVVEQFDLDVRTFERVIAIERGFDVTTRSLTGIESQYCARKLILATGGTARPRTLGIPGEHLPHVTHDLGDPHRFFRRRVLVVGGRNSAVEAALRCHHVGARVAISYRGAQFPERVKYWLRPEIEDLIRSGRIDAHFGTRPIEIAPDHVMLQRMGDGSAMRVETDFILLMIGYEADTSLFEMAGVTLAGEQRAPVFNDHTMETNVPGVYVAGTAAAGTQQSFRLFIENCHVHVVRIASAITGREIAIESPHYTIAES